MKYIDLLDHPPQDADLELAAKNIVKGGYSYSGQRCTAVKLVLAHESIADKLVEKVRTAQRFAVTSCVIGRQQPSSILAALH